MMKQKFSILENVQTSFRIIVLQNIYSKHFPFGQDFRLFRRETAHYQAL